MAAGKRGFRTSLEDFKKATEDISIAAFRAQIWPICREGYKIVGSNEERYVRAVAPAREDFQDNGAWSVEDFDPLINRGREEALEELKEELDFHITDEAERNTLLRYVVELSRKRTEREKDSKRKWARRNAKSWIPFRPLDRPALIQEFAELALNEITEEIVLEWAREYGVLGLYGIPTRRSMWQHFFERIPVGGPGETVRGFKAEAEEALAVVQTYDALTAQGGPDEEALRDIYERPKTPLPHVIEVATNRLERTVQLRLERHCYLRQHPTEGGWMLGYGFYSLLGAMYIQLAWVMQNAAVPRRCKRPACNALVLPGKSNKGRPQEFCSKSCSNRWRYLYKTKLKRNSDPPLA